MALGTLDTLEQRIGGREALVRLFDRDRDGAPDDAFVAAAMAYADARVYADTATSHPGVTFDNPGPVPALILDIWARLAIGWAGRASAAARKPEDTPYAWMEASAIGDLKALREGTGPRLPSGGPQPYADGAAYVHAPPTPFGDAADPCRGTGGSGGFSGF